MSDIKDVLSGGVKAVLITGCLRCPYFFNSYNNHGDKSIDDYYCRYYKKRMRVSRSDRSFYKDISTEFYSFCELKVITGVEDVIVPDHIAFYSNYTELWFGMLSRRDYLSGRVSDEGVYFLRKKGSQKRRSKK